MAPYDGSKKCVINVDDDKYEIVEKNGEIKINDKLIKPINNDDEFQKFRNEGKK